jgi:hypothetical protein
MTGDLLPNLERFVVLLLLLILELNFAGWDNHNILLGVCLLRESILVTRPQKSGVFPCFVLCRLVAQL